MRSSSRRGRGGKGGAEPTARVRLREIQAMQLHLEGQSQLAIAATLKLSQPAVSKILKRVEERLLTDLALRVDRQRARQSLRLDFLYGEAFGAWRASQEDGLRKRQRKTEGAAGTGSTTVAELTSEERYGDPRFLEVARRVLADARALWGLDAPERIAVATTNPFATLSDEAVREEMDRLTTILSRADAHPSRVPSKVPKE